MTACIESKCAFLTQLFLLTWSKKHWIMMQVVCVKTKNDIVQENGVDT